MSVLESINMSVKAVIANRTRSILTMIGIVIGVAAVIAMVSLGEGAQSSITGSLMSLGTNLVIVETRGYARLEAADVEEWIERVPALEKGTPIFGTFVAAKTGTSSVSVEMWGVRHDFLEIMSYGTSQGRFFTQEEVASRQKVVFIGSQVLKDLFDNRRAAGETITLNGEPYLVTGVAGAKGSVMGQNYDNKIIVPYTTAQRMMGSKYTTFALLKATSDKASTAAADRLSRILEEKYRNVNRQLDHKNGGVVTEPFRVYCQEEMKKSLDSMTGTLTLLLAGIAAISLIVGGIGIMNIMLVSVTERTREIGIRKSIGATRAQVLGQFLVEALLLSATGGVLGIILGGQMAKSIGQLGDLAVSVSPAAAAIAFGFSSLVGVFFGIYPAMRAANMDPITALRHE